jgi:hypothetical protein
VSFGTCGFDPTSGISVVDLATLAFVVLGSA